MIPLGVLGSARRNGGAALAADYLTTLTDGTENSTKTWAGVSLGAAAADRSILVIITANTVNGGVAISSLTVGGVAATVDLVASGQYTDVRLFFARISLPTGTTGDVVLTLSSEWRNVAVSLYRVTGAAVAYHSYQRTITSGAALTCSTVAGGLVLGSLLGGGYRNDSVWTGLPEDADVTINGWRRSVAHATTASAGTLSVSGTFGDFGGCVPVTYAPA